MKSTWPRERVLRYLLLFLISVTLVAGFWFHAEFYELGLLPLLLIGGLATFLVLVALQGLATGRLFRVRPRWSLPLPRDAVGRGLDGTQTLAIVGLGVAIPPAGSVATVVVDAERPVARMRIHDVRRVLFDDLSESDAIAAGYDGLGSFRASWSRGHAPDPKEILVLVDFRLEAHG